jgi:hypothetical protein
VADAAGTLAAVLGAEGGFPYRPEDLEAFLPQRTD